MISPTVISSNDFTTVNSDRRLRGHRLEPGRDALEVILRNPGPAPFWTVPPAGEQSWRAGGVTWGPVPILRPDPPVTPAGRTVTSE